MVIPLLQRPLILVFENELSEREVFLSDLLDSRVEVVSYVDALKLEVQNLCEVNIVEGVRLVNPVLQRLRGSRRRFVIVERKFGRRDGF